MKTIILFALIAVNCAAEDIRTVSGIKVDLQSIHDWTIKQEGKRPLKHWKTIEVRDYVRNMGGYEQCAIKSEDLVKTVLILNLPLEFKTHFQKLSALGKKIEELTSYIDAEGKRVSYLDATTPTGAGGDPDYVNAVMKKRYRINADALNLGEKQREAEALAKEYLDESKRILTDLAMFTGKLYAGLEIWDFGAKGK